MKKKRIEKILKKKLAGISGNLQSKNASAEQIHELRVSYKELRAFLRLLHFSGGGGRLPKKLKALYNAAGDVRDMQLFIDKTANAPSVAQLHTYTGLLNARLRDAGFALSGEVSRFSAKKTSKKIIRDIPASIGDAIITDYLQDKYRDLKRHLKSTGTDRNLHAIRKLIKDVIYLENIVGNKRIIPAPLKDLKVLATDLGDYHDLVTAIELLDSDMRNPLPDNEKETILKIRSAILLQKKELFNQVSRDLKILLQFR